jgi:hypothetical protein
MVGRSSKAFPPAYLIPEYFNGGKFFEDNNYVRDNCGAAL